MARLQWCRKHIDEVGENCGLSPRSISEVKQAADFCKEHCEFSQQPTSSIMPLIRIKEPEIKARAISSISKALESGKHPITGKHLKKGRLTEADVKKVIEDERKAVERLLNDAEWKSWSDNKIAEICKVSDKTVARYRSDTSEIRSMDQPSTDATTPESRTFIHPKTGNPTQMNVENIGKKPEFVPASQIALPTETQSNREEIEHHHLL